MQKFQASRVVLHGARDMFELVADLENYPKYVPHCEVLSVRRRDVVNAGEMAIVDIAGACKLFRKTFTSRVMLDRDNLQILVEYLDGPFRHLENRWAFLAAERSGCQIELTVFCKYRLSSIQLLVGVIFDHAFRKFADAFEERAYVIYGHPRFHGAMPHLNWARNGRSI